MAAVEEEGVRLETFEHHEERVKGKFEVETMQIGFDCQGMSSELQSWDLWRAGIAELLATMMFLFFTIGTVSSNTLNMKQGDSPTAGLLLMISMCFGFMICILVYGIAGISGGNINPAVSIALAITKRITPLRMVVYVIAQCIGAIVGCRIAKAVHGEADYNPAINSLQPHASASGAFVGEILGTALLVFTVFAAIDGNNKKPGRMGYRIMKSTLAPWVIGLAVMMAHIVLIPIDNCSINPARSFGASVIAQDFSDHYIFWVGPIVGGIIAALLYEGVFKERAWEQE